MVQIDEVHGLYQCLPEEIHETAEPDQHDEQDDYVPLTADKYWFYDEHLREVEARGLHNPKYSHPHDFIQVKHQLDALFLQKRYAEGLQLSLKCFGYHGEEGDVKRELVDLIGQFAIKLKDGPSMERCLQWLDKYCAVQDTGIYWLRIHMAKATGDHETIRKACHDYLRMRPAEPEILDILNSL